MVQRDDTIFSKLKHRLTVGNILLTLLGIVATAALTGAGRPVVQWATEIGDYARDSAFCGGRAAMVEGDRLSDAASRDVKQAQSLFREANVFYSKAYACGFADAGVRLAASHCLGLGTEKNEGKAKQLLLEVERDHSDRKVRIDLARKACKI